MINKILRVTSDVFLGFWRLALRFDKQGGVGRHYPPDETVGFGALQSGSYPGTFEALQLPEQSSFGIAVNLDG